MSNIIVQTKLKNSFTSIPLSIKEFIDFAIAVSTNLVETHKVGQIHGTICPENIFWNSKTLKAQLVDPVLGDKKPLFNTAHLPYISPEQTRRMNLNVDYRTDLYSLGIVFFEMLVGEPPFIAEDNLEMIHLHIASIPPKPHTKRVEVPEQISNIILRLLKKNPDDRYQSAYGLQHDLELCAELWELNGMVKQFELGESDHRGRFRVSQKLYGRENELKLLFDSFERVSAGSKELITVVGYSGVGKSLLVQRVQKPITTKHGFFIDGKFDQYKRNIPYFAWHQVFGTLVNQLLTKSDDRLAYWKTRILGALGQNGKVLTDVFGNLELIIGPQADVPLLGDTEALNRFNSVIQNFIKEMAYKDHPLVIFLDDLQWIDSASLLLLHTLIIDPDLSHVQFIGAYRDNEVDPSHPLTLFLKKIKEEQVILKQIVLQNLLKEDVNTLIADTLETSPVYTLPLAELIYSKTGGNAFFTHQILQTLHDKNLLTFDVSAGNWNWNLEVLKALDITKNVVEFLTSSMQDLPEAYQYILKLAACIGNLFDIETLLLIVRKQGVDIEGNLKMALQEEIILYQNGKYKFAHDRIQQAAYALIPEDSKKETHLEIGRILFERIPEEKRKERVFDIVNQLNIGAELLSTRAEQIQLVQLNLAAGQKAKANAAYSDAKKFIEIGIELLGTSGWQKQYDLTLLLHNENGELAGLTGQFDQVSTTVSLIRDNTNNVLDRVRIYMTQIEAETAQYNIADALEIGLAVLGEMGFEIPDQPTIEDRQLLHDKFNILLTSDSLGRLAQIPAMSDKKAQGASSLFASIMSTSYIIKPSLFPIISYQGAILSLEYGLDVWTPFFFGGVTLVNFASIDRDSPVNEALNLIEFYKPLVSVIHEMLDNPVTARSRSKCLMMMAFTVPWVASIEQSVEFSQATYSSGYETGDWLYSSYGAVFFSVLAFDAGLNLEVYETRLSSYISNANRMGYLTPATEASIFLQTALIFKKISPEPHKLIGTYFNEEEWLQDAISTNDMAGRHYFYLAKLILVYHFKLDKELDEYVANAENSLAGGQGMYSTTLFHFYVTLARLRLISGSSSKKPPKTMKLIDKSLHWMAIWSRSVPSTFQHKYELMKAEKSRVTGRIDSALSNYEQAINGAREHGFIQEEALANELYARFWIERNNDRFARPLMREAHSLYLKWGARGKADHLANCYPEFFITPNIIANDSATQSISDQEFSDLDLRTVLKASLTIAGEMELDKLLAKMMHIIIENAGAQQGFLILARGEEWIIQGIAEVDKNKVQVLQSMDIEKNDTVSSGIIHYVARTRETIVLEDAAHEGEFISDHTIQRRKSRSVLCMPLINLGRISGILYLENNLTPDAFTPGHVELLKLLSSEMAMALDNAQVYHNLELGEKRFRATFEQAAVGIAHVSPEGRFLRINQKYCDIVGYSYEETLQLTFQDITYPDDLESDVTQVNQLLAGEIDTYSMDKRYISKNGELVWVNLTVSLVRNEAEQPQWFVAVVNDITERKFAEQSILKYQRRLKDLAHKITITEEAIRKQVAVDLHDNVGQLLASIRIQLSKINKVEENPVIKDRIENISQTMRGAIQATRDAIFNLSPPQLNEIGLYPAVHDWMKEQIEFKHGIVTSISGEDENLTIDVDTRYLLFRSIRELMHNVVKHSQATKLDVNFCKNNGSLEITVRDNGRGFDYNPDQLRLKSDSYGLFSINERLNDLDGSMVVNSIIGKGSNIKLTIPLKDK